MSTPQDPFAAPDPDAPPPQRPAEPAPYAASGAAAGPYGQQPVQARNGFGTAALVLGILALLTSITVVGGILLGIVAVVFGALGRGRGKRGDATNGSSATAGLVLGIVALVVAGGLIAVGASFLNSDKGQKLRDCLENAGTDQAAQQQCQEEFTRDFGY